MLNTFIMYAIVGHPKTYENGGRRSYTPNLADGVDLLNGRESTSIFVASSFGPEKQRSKLHTPHKATMGEPSTGLIHQ